MRFASRIGLRKARPGAAGQRLPAAVRGPRDRAAGAPDRGGGRAPPGSRVRVRPTNDVHQVVVAFPWRNRTRAQALGRAVAEVLDALLSPDLEELVSHAAESVRGLRAPAPGPPRCARGCRSSRSPAPTARPRPRGWSRTSPARTACTSAGRAPTASTSTASWSSPATTPARRAPAGCWPTSRCSSRSPRPPAAASCSRASG